MSNSTDPADLTLEDILSTIRKMQGERAGQSAREGTNPADGSVHATPSDAARADVPSPSVGTDADQTARLAANTADGQPPLPPSPGQTPPAPAQAAPTPPAVRSAAAMFAAANDTTRPNGAAAHPAQAGGSGTTPSVAPWPSMTETPATSTAPAADSAGAQNGPLAGPWGGAAWETRDQGTSGAVAAPPPPPQPMAPQPARAPFEAASQRGTASPAPTSQTASLPPAGPPPAPSDTGATAQDDPFRLFTDTDRRAMQGELPGEAASARPSERAQNREPGSTLTDFNSFQLPEPDLPDPALPVVGAASSAASAQGQDPAPTLDAPTAPYASGPGQPVLPDEVRKASHISTAADDARTEPTFNMDVGQAASNTQATGAAEPALHLPDDTAPPTGGGSSADAAANDPFSDFFGAGFARAVKARPDGHDLPQAEPDLTPSAATAGASVAADEAAPAPSLSTSTPGSVGPFEVESAAQPPAPVQPSDAAAAAEQTSPIPNLGPSLPDKHPIVAPLNVTGPVLPPAPALPGLAPSAALGGSDRADQVQGAVAPALPSGTASGPELPAPAPAMTGALPRAETASDAEPPADVPKSGAPLGDAESAGAVTAPGLSLHDAAAAAADGAASAIPAAMEPAQDIAHDAALPADDPDPAVAGSPSTGSNAAPTPAPATLAVPATGGGGLGERRFDDAIVELLRPMLREWIDENMPRLMEKAAQAEAAAQRVTSEPGSDAEDHSDAEDRGGSQSETGAAPGASSPGV